MTHYRQWSAAFASYFTFMGLWTAFGPVTLMAASPQAAPLALAAITLAYFVATPLVRRLWNLLGFPKTIVLMGGGVCLCLCSAALAPQWLALCVPLAFFFGSGSYTLCETKMLEDLAQAGQGHAFGRARKWGSFGFLAAAALGGAAFSMGGVGHAFTYALGLCGLAYLACCVALARAHGNDAHANHGALPLATDALDSRPLQLESASPVALGTLSAPQRWAGAAAVSAMRLAEAIATTWFGAWWLSTGHSPLQTGLLCALPVVA
jgi:ABC-type glucose/galactose transport system permease subunit